MYALLRSILFLLSPERAHRWAIRLLEAFKYVPGGRSLLAFLYRPKKSVPIELFGCRFNHRLGLAAGFDKNGHYLDSLENLGFAFLEVGSVTANPWNGNPQPRLFRLKEEHAIINRMGLNNEGAGVISERLARRSIGVPLFVNIAKTADPTIEGQAAVEDYCQSIRCVKSAADVLVINISCPNSGDGRTFEDPEALTSLLVEVQKEIGPDGPPYLVKLSPDLDDAGIRQVVELGTRYGAAGFTATNTTTDRSLLKTPASELSTIGPGGLSGRPLNRKSVDVVKALRALTDLPIVGVGGITDAQSRRLSLMLEPHWFKCTVVLSTVGQD